MKKIIFKFSEILLITILVLFISNSKHAQSSLGITFAKQQIVDNINFSPWSEDGVALSIRPTYNNGHTDVSIQPSGSNHAARLYIHYDDPLGAGINRAYRNLIIETGGGPGGEGSYILTETTNGSITPPLPIRIGSGDFNTGSIRDLLVVQPSLTDGQDGGIKMGSQSLYFDFMSKHIRQLPTIPNTEQFVNITNWVPVRDGNDIITGYLPVYGN